MPKDDNKTALIIFAREPKWGKVKTRLAKVIDQNTVLRLYKAFIKDVFAAAKAVRCDERFVYYVGTGASIPYLRAQAKGFSLKRQRAGDLGERMYHAFKACFDQGFKKVVIIGTDCLTVTAIDLRQAFKLLEEEDCVIGPTADGGYYLLGLRSPSKRIFSGIRWSTHEVFEKTVLNCERAGKTFSFLSEKQDIDMLDDLYRFFMKKTNKDKAGNTYQLLEKLKLSF